MEGINPRDPPRPFPAGFQPLPRGFCNTCCKMRISLRELRNGSCSSREMLAWDLLAVWEVSLSQKNPQNPFGRRNPLKSMDFFFHKYVVVSANPHLPRKKIIWFSLPILKNWFSLGPVSFPQFDFPPKHSRSSLSSIRPFPISGSTSRPSSWKISGFKVFFAVGDSWGKPQRGKTLLLQTPQAALT